VLRGPNGALRQAAHAAPAGWVARRTFAMAETR
jgi:hypothetical protein